MVFRAFIAVELTGLEQISVLVEELRSLQAPFKLVKPENMHITLKFLGDTREEMVPGITTVIQSACEGVPAFDVEYTGLGAFPNQKKMSVLWAGIKGAEPMKDMAEKIDQGVETLGFKPETRPFKAHLTLGRLKRHKKMDGRIFNKMQELFEVYKDQALGGCTVNKIVLKKSTLTPQGPIYEDLKEVVLGL